MNERDKRRRRRRGHPAIVPAGNIDTSALTKAPLTRAPLQSEILAPAVARQNASRSRSAAHALNNPPKPRLPRGAKRPPAAAKPTTAGKPAAAAKPKSPRSLLGTKPLTPKLPYRPSYLGKGNPEYDDSQPRGADGKWTSGGASGGSASAMPKPADFTGSDAGNKYRLATAAALGVSVLAAGAGTYIMLRRGIAPAYIVVQPATTASGKSFMLGVEKGADDVAALVKSTLDRLPAAHVAAVKGSGISIYAVKNMGDVESALIKAPVVSSGLLGFFHPGARSIIVPGNIMVHGNQRAVPPAVIQRVLAHEFAHALDSKGAGVGYLSKPLLKSISDEYAAYLRTSPEYGKLLHAWFQQNYKTADNIRNEIFAEVYSAKYLNQGNWRQSHYTFFGGMMNEHAVAKHFPQTMAAMDKLDLSAPRGMTGFQHAVESRAINSGLIGEPGTRLKEFLASTKRDMRKGEPEFNPDQARGPDGKWTDGGGSSGAAAGAPHKNLGSVATGLASISSREDAVRAIKQVNDAHEGMAKLPATAWRDPTALDHAWKGYLTTVASVGALAAVTVVLGGVFTAGTLIAGAHVSPTHSAIGAGLMALFPKGYTSFSYTVARRYLSTLFPKEAIAARTALGVLPMVGAGAAGLGAVLATAMALRYAYRQFETNGRYEGVSSINRRIELLDHHIDTLTAAMGGRPSLHTASPSPGVPYIQVGLTLGASLAALGGAAKLGMMAYRVTKLPPAALGMFGGWKTDAKQMARDLGDDLSRAMRRRRPKK